MSAWTQTAKKGGGDQGFEKPPAGNHLAVLVAIVDMGTQTVSGFQGAPDKDQHRAYFVWELVACKTSSGVANHVIGIDLNLSLNEKAKLRKWIEARTGKVIPDGADYNVLSELGQPCLLNVVMKGEYPKVEGVAGVPAGIPVPAAQLKPFAWSLDDYRKTNTIDLPHWLPYFYGNPIADAIRGCKELKGTPAATTPPPPTTPGPAFAAPPPPPSAAPPSPPAAPAPPPPTVGTQPPLSSRWQWYNGLAWVEGFASELINWMQSSGTHPSAVPCRPHGSIEQPRYANLWGFQDPLPY